MCQQFNFDRDVVETDALKTLTLDDVRQFYRDYIAPDAPKRRKMATLVVPANDDGETQQQAKEKAPKKVGAKVGFVDVMENRSFGFFWVGLGILVFAALNVKKWLFFESCKRYLARGCKHLCRKFA